MIEEYLFDFDGKKYLIPKETLNDKMEYETGFRSFSGKDKYEFKGFYGAHLGKKDKFFIEDDYTGVIRIGSDTTRSHLKHGGSERLLYTEDLSKFFYSKSDIRDEKLQNILDGVK